MPRNRRLTALAAILLSIVASLVGCAPEPDYLPLEPGRWWYYQLTSLILDEPHEARAIVSNLGRGEINGIEVSVQGSQATSIDYLVRDGRGTLRVARKRAREFELTLDRPQKLVLPGSDTLHDAWTRDSTLLVVESRTFARQDRIIRRRYPVTLEYRVAAQTETVTVPAGRFEHCLVLEGLGETNVRTDRGNSTAKVTVSTREWYAPDVGLVRRERRESSTSKFLKSGARSWSLLEYGR